MKRERMLKSLREQGHKKWDLVIIGGGASGLGAAVDAASRGYKTLLLEAEDFAKGTSSRSTKLVHGGVRYLAQGDVSMVLEALYERGLLFKNAPHLVKNQSFIIPTYTWWTGPFYSVGMKVYDMMAGKFGLGPSERLSREETLKRIPNLKTKGLTGGVIYYDGQFDDARLALNLAQTVHDNRGTVINYMKVKGLIKNKAGLTKGVTAEDRETGKLYTVRARCVINATGVFSDQVLAMDKQQNRRTIVPSRGVHLVLPREFLASDSAVMIPKTEDGRVLFAVPWHGRIVVGTTDTPVNEPVTEPRASEAEIDFILQTAGRYLTKAPSRSDVLSVFAGLRPLAAPDESAGSTKEISRGHKITVSDSGLVSMTGGKWTTYRKMGEDAINTAAVVAGLPERAPQTKYMPVHGYVRNMNPEQGLERYGSDLPALLRMQDEIPGSEEVLHSSTDILKVQVYWAVRREMARKVEDVLARRCRLLMLNARAARSSAQITAEIMAAELGKDEEWIRQETDAFVKLAGEYLPEIS